MKCELMIIAQKETGLQQVVLKELEGTPRQIANTIARLHGGLHSDCLEGIWARYSILTEFDDEGVVQ